MGGSAPDVTDAERAQRHRVIQDHCDALMDVFDLGFSTHTNAIDATGIWSWDKGRFRSTTPTDDTEGDDAPG